MTENSKIDSKNKEFIIKYWYVFILGALLIATIILQIINSIIVKAPVQQANTWFNITPGYSSLRDVENSFGKPLSRSNTENGTALYYESHYPAQPNEVIINDSNQVQFIKEYLPPLNGTKIDQYIAEYGEPDLILIDEKTGDSTLAHVFLKQGLVILSHITGGTVEQRWYFEPTDEQTFMRSWGSTLIEGFGPETFDFGEEQ